MYIFVVILVKSKLNYVFSFMLESVHIFMLLMFTLTLSHCVENDRLSENGQRYKSSTKSNNEMFRENSGLTASSWKRFSMPLNVSTLWVCDRIWHVTRIMSNSLSKSPIKSTGSSWINNERWKDNHPGWIPPDEGSSVKLIYYSQCGGNHEISSFPRNKLKTMEWDIMTKLKKQLWWERN